MKKTKNLSKVELTRRAKFYAEMERTAIKFEIKRFFALKATDEPYTATEEEILEAIK